MSNELNIQEKATVLFKNGFLRIEDRKNIKRIVSRWLVYLNIPQKTPRAVKGDTNKGKG